VHASIPHVRRQPAAALLRGLAVLAMVVGVLCVSRTASAQMVQLNTGVPLTNTPSTHPAGFGGTWISYQDCIQDATVTVPLELTPPAGGWAGYGLYVFATASPGVDCGDPSQRSAMTGSCWAVTETYVPPVTGTDEVTIPIREMLANLDAGGTGIDPSYPGTVGPDVCSSVTTSGTHPLFLQFVLFTGDETNEQSNLTLGFLAELFGPAPPTSVDAGVGNEQLTVTWTPSTDPATTGYDIFIDPLPGHEGMQTTSTTDAAVPVTIVCPDGSTPDGSAGLPSGCHYTSDVDAEAAPAVCPSTILVGSGTTTTTTLDASTTDSALTDTTDAAIGTTTTTGSLAPPSQAVLGQFLQTLSGQTTSQVTIQGLKNGVVYTVAVTAVDELADNGPLSNPACETPSVIEDFYEEYRADGGLAGGGFCALEGPGMPTGAGVFGVALVAACVAWKKRRGRRPS